MPPCWQKNVKVRVLTKPSQRKRQCKAFSTNIGSFPFVRHHDICPSTQTKGSMSWGSVADKRRFLHTIEARKGMVWSFRQALTYADPIPIGLNRMISFVLAPGVLVVAIEDVVAIVGQMKLYWQRGRICLSHCHHCRRHDGTRGKRSCYLRCHRPICCFYGLIFWRQGKRTKKTGVFAIRLLTIPRS